MGEETPRRHRANRPSWELGVGKMRRLKPEAVAACLPRGSPVPSSSQRDTRSACTSVAVEGLALGTFGALSHGDLGAHVSLPVPSGTQSLICKVSDGTWG